MTETNDLYGVGFRPQHYGWVTTQRPPEVDIFEIVSENFMGVGGRPRFFLEKLRENYPILMHGVGLSIGSVDPLDPIYLKQLKELIHFVEPQMVSDHLSWNQFARRNSHDLFPLVYTQRTMNELIGKLNYLQEYLGRRFFLENPSAYVAFEAGDYSEAEFFAELLKRTGAGMLLDINNLYVNQKNLDQNPDDFFRALRREDVGYFHLAGHSDQGDVLVDTHDQEVPDSVWSLFAKAKHYFPNVPAIVEWDGNIPEFPVLLAECQKARNCPRAEIQDLTENSVDSIRSEKSDLSNSLAHAHFFDQIAQPFGITDTATKYLKPHLPTRAEVGMKVYNHAYFLRLEEVLIDNFPNLAFVTEPEGFRHLIASYLDACPPTGSSLKTVSANLPEFLRNEESQVDYDFGVSLRVLGDIASLEWARCQAFLAVDDPNLLSPEDLRNFTAAEWDSTRLTVSSLIRLVDCDFDVLPVVKAIENKEAPSLPEEKPCHYFVSRTDGAIENEFAEEGDVTLYHALASGVTLQDACDALTVNSPGFYDSDMISFVAKKILDWSSKGRILRSVN